jgi:ClpP class serine protease
VKAFDLANGQPWAIAHADFARFDEWAASAEIDPQSLAAFQGRPIDGSEAMTIRDGVATIPVRGMIFRHDTPLTRFIAAIFGGSITDALAADFGLAIRNPDVRQILLQVDSPGGHAAGIGELAHMIHASPKPVVAYVGSLGASAAYYLASAASSVVVDPSAMLGSIGVVVGMAKKRPTDPTEIVSSQSPHKRSDPETEAGRAKIQAVVDAMAAVFIADVARFRGTTPERVQSDFGQGGVKLGQDAVDAGMADHVGSYEQTLDLMRRGESPPRRKTKPAPKASVTPKEPAMSEPNPTAVAGEPSADTTDYKALYEAEQKRRATAEAEAKAQLDARLEQAAEAFAASLSSGEEAVATPADRAANKAAYLQAARDDHDRPVAGNPSFRQDALKAAYGKRNPHQLLGEVTAANPATKTTALASDPAGGSAVEPPDTIEATARRYAARANGTATKN